MFELRVVVCGECDQRLVRQYGAALVDEGEICDQRPRRICVVDKNVQLNNAKMPGGAK